MALEPRCRHLASAEPMAHGRNRKPCRRDGRLHPHEPAERPDPARSPMATPTAGLGIEAAYQGAAGGLDTRRMEAVRRGHGTRLPTRTGTAKPSKAVEDPAPLPRDGSSSSSIPSRYLERLRESEPSP